MRAERGIRDAERRRHRRVLGSGDRRARGHRGPARLFVPDQGLLLRQRPAARNVEAGGRQDRVRALRRYRRHRGGRPRSRHSPDACRRLRRAHARRQRLYLHDVRVRAAVTKDAPRIGVVSWAVALFVALAAAKAVLLALRLADGALPVARPWLPVALVHEDVRLVIAFSGWVALAAAISRRWPGAARALAAA